LPPTLLPTKSGQAVGRMREAVSDLVNNLLDFGKKSAG
jgi:hypothetical protein